MNIEQWFSETFLQRLMPYAKSTTLVLLMGLGVVLFSVSKVSAKTDNYSSSFSHKKLQKQICLAIEGNDLIKFRTLIRDARARVSELYKYLECEGQELIVFSRVKSAEKISDYLKVKVSSRSAAAWSENRALLKSRKS